MAQSISKSEYKTAENNIAVEYKSAKAKCGSLAGNANDICVEEAKGKRKVAKAELEARYKPSKKADYEVRVAKAEAEYAVAKEKCDDKAGNDKDVCLKKRKPPWRVPNRRPRHNLLARRQTRQLRRSPLRRARRRKKRAAKRARTRRLKSVTRIMPWRRKNAM